MQKSDLSEAEFIDATTRYLETKEVYDLFDNLLKELVINQPEKPIRFLIDNLKKTPPLIVFVVGPPGVGRRDLCAKMAAEYAVKHIQVGALLRETSGTQKDMENCNLIRDDVVIEAVKAQVMKFKDTGFVMDGFPRTKTQAQALQRFGFTVDKVLLLNASENKIRQRFDMKLGGSGAEKEANIAVRLQHYYRHAMAVAEVFQNVIRQINADAEPDAVYGQMKKCVMRRAFSNAPTRPPRLCVIGPLGSGRTTQSRLLAQAYGAVHVDVEVLIRDLSERKPELGGVAVESISDEDVCEAVGRRLKDVDCVRKGWVLDGFPMSEGQAQFLRDAHLWPSRLINLSVDEEAVVERLGKRKRDPVTGLAYYGNPPTVAIRQRLVQAEFDKPAHVRNRYKKYEDAVPQVMVKFAAVSTSFGKDEPKKLQEKIQEFIDRPLPQEEQPPLDY